MVLRLTSRQQLRQPGRPQRGRRSSRGGGAVPVLFVCVYSSVLTHTYLPNGQSGWNNEVAQYCGRRCQHYRLRIGHAKRHTGGSQKQCAASLVASCSCFSCHVLQAL